MKNTILPILIILLLSGACKRSLEIVSHQKSDYTIIIPLEAGNHDSTAALYLAGYIGKMTGAVVPVKHDTAKTTQGEICIGKTNRQPDTEEFAPDAYNIRTVDGKLFITGGNQKGVIYGVIELLEKWGCRKFSPAESSIPRHDKLMLEEMNITRSPRNHLRIINGKMIQDAEYADWLRITTVAEVAPPGYYVHTFQRLIPREEFFDEHPEYYALLGNKYSFDQPCPSRPEVKDIILDRLAAEMERYPEFDIWSVSQNDNFTYCQCDRCKAIIEEEGSPAGPVIRLVNEVAAAFPDKTIATLAYQFSRPAPVKTRPANNVLVRLCTIELNRSRPIEYDSMSRDFVRDIGDWSKICNNIYLWDYTINFNHSVSPFPNLHVLQPNMQFFYENNVRMQFPQTNLQTGHEFAELKAKMLSALMWDPYVNIDSVRDDFIENYYREAAPFMKAYADRMEKELISSGRILYIYDPPNNHSNGFLSAENTAIYDSLFDKAEAAVAHRPEVLNRVRISGLPLQYAIMEIAKNDMFGPRGWYDEVDGEFIIRHEMKKTLETFYQVCSSNQIATLNEKSLTPEIYYTNALRFIDVKVEGNHAFRKAVVVSPPAAEKYAYGNPLILTDGVQGAHDFAVHWLGWWGEDAIITVDLEKPVKVERIEIGTLWDGRSWVLHPASLKCLTSKDGTNYALAGERKVTGDQQFEEITRKFSFEISPVELQFIRFELTGAGPLPRWHASEGQPSWFFVDEISVY